MKTKIKFFFNLYIHIPSPWRSIIWAQKFHNFLKILVGHCASNSSSNGAITAENTALFKTWISKHKSIKNEEEFLSKCVNGGRVPNPFFPFQSSEVQSAKILFLDDSGPKGVQAGRIGYVTFFMELFWVLSSSVLQDHFDLLISRK